MELKPPDQLRFDLSIIASWIKPGARVLDLGCGHGDLLAWLKHHKDIQGTGVEQDPKNPDGPALAYFGAVTDEWKDKQTREEVEAFVPRYYTAFNVRQTEGIAEAELPPDVIPEKHEFTRIERCEQVVEDQLVAPAQGAPYAIVNQADAPSCPDCGSIMIRSGACYKCPNCGGTSGCS